MTTESVIERFIVDEIMLGDREVKFGAEDDLIMKGILDSLALMRMIVFIEEQFGVKVADDELLPSNFESLTRIRTFIERKKALAV